MLNLRYWFFTNPSGPATIMAPTALVPIVWLLSNTSMRCGVRASSKRSRRPSSRVRCEELSASLRPSASRAFCSACSTTPVLAPRCGTRTSTLRSRASEANGPRSVIAMAAIRSPNPITTHPAPTVSADWFRISHWLTDDATAPRAANTTVNPAMNARITRSNRPRA